VLREASAPTPDAGRTRRWFADDSFDLVVWVAPAGTVAAFELCYDRPAEERALTWSAEDGFRHFRVDAGEDTPTRNRSPILVAGGGVPGAELVARFAEASRAIDPAIRAFVLDRLASLPS